jgi:hypothetical protein
MIASAGRLALSNIGFLIPFIAGRQRFVSFTYVFIGEVTKKSLSIYDIISLLVLIIGMVVYKLKKERRVEKSVPPEDLHPLLINVEDNT